jgi:hypothetical protein
MTDITDLDTRAARLRKLVADAQDALLGVQLAASLLVEGERKDREACIKVIGLLLAGRSCSAGTLRDYPDSAAAKAMALLHRLGAETEDRSATNGLRVVK